jgi:hypothetical protein
VLFRLGGTASGAGDYVAPLTDRLVIPAGSATATLGFPILDDTEGESAETITVAVAYPVLFSRRAQGQEFFVYYRGWEVTEDMGTKYWTQTRPNYVPAENSVVEVTVIDDDLSSEHTVSLTASDIIALEEPLVESAFVLSRSGNTAETLTVHLEVSGSAESGLDFEPLPASVTFEAGETLRELPLRPVADANEEPTEEVRLRVVPHPDYAVGRDAASITLRDRLVFPQTLSISTVPNAGLQLVMKGAPGQRLILEYTTDFLTWKALRTNFLFNTDSASLLLSNPAGTRFFRTSR